MLIHCPWMTKKSSKSVNLRSWSHHDVCREINLNDLFVIKLIGVWFWIWMIHFTDFLRSYGDGNVEVNSQAFQSLSRLSSCPATPWRPPRPLPCTRIRLTAGIFSPRHHPRDRDISALVWSSLGVFLPCISSQLFAHCEFFSMCLRASADTRRQCCLDREAKRGNSLRRCFCSWWSEAVEKFGVCARVTVPSFVSHYFFACCLPPGTKGPASSLCSGKYGLVQLSVCGAVCSPCYSPRTLVCIISTSLTSLCVNPWQDAFCAIVFSYHNIVGSTDKKKKKKKKKKEEEEGRLSAWLSSTGCLVGLQQIFLCDAWWSCRPFAGQCQGRDALLVTDQ